MRYNEIEKYPGRAAWCFRFEDFMGVMRILAASCRKGKGLPPHI